MTGLLDKKDNRKTIYFILFGVLFLVFVSIYFSSRILNKDFISNEITITNSLKLVEKEVVSKTANISTKDSTSIELSASDNTLPSTKLESTGDVKASKTPNISGSNSSISSEELPLFQLNPEIKAAIATQGITTGSNPSPLLYKEVNGKSDKSSAIVLEKKCQFARN
ncbi:MAG: hypothetical protein ACJA01_003597 [Saprospiraceae bacterium]|jgi:hypothetical protein